ncbi:transmembrane protein, putative [Rhizoctonia solani AG-3 Rhs1AP]|uniref:Transmembrane protein, putative n=2 Tax=Rhizoctonia solani AG-3 TaxID=1086053 RepID=X8J4R8_9AGAM|nr:transmembrane protein, putative [Rhizoctonia solani AG-3 Rhs1AP]KEP52284.1 putative transmembrane protein [Rhizoctonia solani 123E]
MAGVWTGYRYSMLAFLLLTTTFVLIISAQNIETGRLVDGGKKSNVLTLIVSIFTTLLLAFVLWLDLLKRLSVILEVRWELIWAAVVILFNIIGFASVASNNPPPNTCHGGPNSAWNICAASQGMLALLALATIALIGHAGTVVVMMIKISRRSEVAVWRIMTWGLCDELNPRPGPVRTTTNVPIVGVAPMSQLEAGTRPVSKVLPPVPIVLDDSSRRDPLTFSTVSSLLNPAPREFPSSTQPAGRYQLYDAPVPVALPPVPRAFERISGYIHDDPNAIVPPGLSLYYAPTPVYDRFARGSETFPSSGIGTPITAGLQPPTPLRIQKKEGRWGLADETGALERTPVGEDMPALQAKAREIQAPVAAQTAPVRRPSRNPPRITPGTLPHPNSYRPGRI